MLFWLYWVMYYWLFSVQGVLGRHGACRNPPKHTL